MKVLLFILLAVSMSSVNAVSHGTAHPYYDGRLFIDGDNAWACFEPTGGEVFCAKVHRSQFCPTELDRDGLIRCKKFI